MTTVARIATLLASRRTLARLFGHLLDLRTPTFETGTLLQSIREEGCQKAKIDPPRQTNGPGQPATCTLLSAEGRVRGQPPKSPRTPWNPWTMETRTKWPKPASPHRGPGHHWRLGQPRSPGCTCAKHRQLREGSWSNACWCGIRVQQRRSGGTAPPRPGPAGSCYAGGAERRWCSL